ncbi:MAG: oligopeptide:H+ symporter [candidate division Zixibacteria bacterium]|nr:oligopeptide:H+ symporter [candidate division Zixibacteria bacterium]
MTAEENRHPRGFWFIFWGELAERASFYGMKTLLLLYMIQKLGYADADSASVVSLFTAFCYILPIVGGYIADHYLGKFKTIIYFAIPYILGHIILGTFTTEVGLYTALLLLAGGSGSIKPNISTLMGLMYQKAGKSHLMTQAFSWYYMAINIGAAITTFSLPFIRDHYGYGPAFMAPTILMIVSLGIFYIGKKHYPKEEIIHTPGQSITKLYFSFSGRINRVKFWLHIVLVLILAFAMVFLIFFMAARDQGVIVGYIIAIPAVLWPALALNVKRCHDRGRSGAYALLAFIPFVNIWYIFDIGFQRGTIGTNDYGPDPVSPETAERWRTEWPVIIRLSGLFLLIVFFWSIFDQSYSTWTLFARDYMILDISLFKWTWHIPPDAVQSLNPVLIVIMTPLFAWLWSRTDRDETHRLSSPRKMLIGFFLVILCMALMTVAGYFGVQSKVSIMWELGAYILITMAELCISVVGLQLAFEEAPERMKSMITGIWLCTVFLGDSLAAWFSRIYTGTTPGNYFGMMTIMIAVVTVLFYYVGRRFERKPENAGIVKA